MNSALIEFEDGLRSIVSRNSLRKARVAAAGAELAPSLGVLAAVSDTPHLERAALLGG